MGDFTTSYPGLDLFAHHKELEKWTKYVKQMFLDTRGHAANNYNP